MIYFATVLRALAAMLITNSHYTGVYPTDFIANGGLLGNVIFFAVSGFCLCNPKQSFPRWYGKRIVRMYPQIWIITALYLLLSISDTGGKSWLELFVYPTRFRFLADILILYIPFYVLMKWKAAQKRLGWILAAVAVVHLVFYLFLFDKTYYHIDAVGAAFILFLYGASMLLGAYFRLHLKQFQNSNKVINWVLLAFFFCAYFASKMLFAKIEAISAFQIINQYMLFLLLYFLVRCFAGIDAKLEALPRWIKRVLNFISEITLEIYLVQIGIIPFFAKLLPFPLNWLVLTSVIVAGAAILHFGTGKLLEGIQLLFKKLRRTKAE